MAVGKATAQQIGQRRVQHADVNAAWGRNRGRRPGLVGVQSLANFFLQRRRVAPGLPLRTEWVAAFHQNLKNQHPQGKGVMLGDAHFAAQKLALQFGRRIFGFAHRAGVKTDPGAAAFLRLEGIDINDSYQCIGAHQHIAFVQVAHDIIFSVQGAQSSRQVARRAMQVQPVKARQCSHSQARIEHLQQ